MESGERQEGALPGQRLCLSYSGRIIDHLGIQMYQSPVAAVAELIANAWDADATEVQIALPTDACNEIVVRDDGSGMSFDECQNRFLNVGLGRRGAEATEKSVRLHRPILGRKGIGKFAGFGIANVIEVATISRDTGEKTVFRLRLDELRGDRYVTQDREVELVEAEGSHPVRASQEHGTIIRLRELHLSRRIAATQFRVSMARRFLLHQRAADFQVLVDGAPLPPSAQADDVEFDFPGAYAKDERPASVEVGADGWGSELVGEQTVRWRIMFHKDPICEEDLRGVAVFCNGKVAQSPFFFQLTGGLSGQFGQQYLSGQVEADYLDAQAEDLIAPERQRVQWEDPVAQPLLLWGSRRTEELLRLWQSRRAQHRREQLENRVQPFAERLGRLQTHEQRTIRRALDRLAGIETLSQTQFTELAEAMLTAWEGGRLRQLIADLAEAEALTPGQLVELLAEANVLTALHVAEAVRAKLEIIGDLKRRADRGERENPLRDEVARNPWVFGPDLETYRAERTVPKLVRDAASTTGLADDQYRGRVDLALTAGKTLAVIEFMRPGLRLNWDHLSRCNRYVTRIQQAVESATGGPWDRVVGYVVADEFDSATDLAAEIRRLGRQDVLVLTWSQLLDRAAAQWREFLAVLAARAPDDPRLQSLL